MPGMTKEVLRQKIKEFGETPPDSWRKNQLEARLVELKDQNPEAKVHDDLLKEMNKAAKKKHDLQVFLTQKLGITITGNETISRLLSLGNQAIMENKPPLATDVMGFGKFAPLTYQEVQEQHPDYTGRCRQTSLEETTCWQMTRYLKWIDQQKETGKTSGMKKGYPIMSSGGTAKAKAFLRPHRIEEPSFSSSTDGTFVKIPMDTSSSEREADEMVEQLEAQIHELQRQKAMVSKSSSKKDDELAKTRKKGQETEFGE